MRNLRCELPTRVKVGPHMYRVTAVPDVGHVVHDGDEDLLGHVDHRSGEITLGTDMSASQKQDTLLHELLHAVLDLLGRDDEALVRLMTPPLLDLLQRNPKLVEYLMQRRLISW